MKFREATFQQTAEDAGSELFVVMPSRDDGQNVFGPVVWASVDGALPQAGDRALVAESDQGFWWVVSWIPST